MAKSCDKIEMVSALKVKKLLDNWDSIPFKNALSSEQKDKLRQYISRKTSVSMSMMALVPCTYHYTRGKKGSSRQTVSGVGLQNLKREIRQTIASDYYVDVDMVNSQPSILLNFCKSSGYPYNGIEYYVLNRDKCLQDLGLPKAEAKQIPLSIINGKKMPEHQKIQWIRDFSNDVAYFHDMIAKSPIYRKKFDAVSSTKSYNVAGTVTSEILLEIENNILLSCEDFLRSMKLSVENLVLIFDGFMIPKSCGFTTDMLVSMSEYVLRKTKYDVKFIIKPFEDIIDLSEFEVNDAIELENKPFVAENDDDASNILLETLNGQVFFCSNQIWLRTKTDRVFISDEAQITLELINRCMDLRIERSGKKKDYSANLCGAKTIALTAMNKIKVDPLYRDESFVDRMISFTKGKIFFKNGYIALKEDSYDKVIERDDDYDVITPVRIANNIPEIASEDTELLDELTDRVFLPIFGTTEMVVNYLEHIARAITGHIEDKDWIIMSGMRNCGKGVLTALNKHTFGIYSNETSANSFLMEKCHTMEDPKKYAWLGQNRWTRILHTSEVKFDNGDSSLKIDGNLIKNKVSSGGDVVEVRDLYQSAIRVKPQCRLFMMCNDVPPITPPDATQTLSKFDFPSQFIDEEMYETKKKEGTLGKNIKKADLSIKDFVSRYDVCSCYLAMVIAAYHDKKVRNCSKVVDDTSSLKSDMGDETSLLHRYFTFTGSKEDIILSKELTAFHKKGLLNISINKLKSLLTFSGAVEDKHFSADKCFDRKGTMRGYYGVSFKDSDGDGDSNE